MGRQALKKYKDPYVGYRSGWYAGHIPEYRRLAPVGGYRLGAPRRRVRVVTWAVSLLCVGVTLWVVTLNGIPQTSFGFDWGTLEGGVVSSEDTLGDPSTSEVVDGELKKQEFLDSVVIPEKSRRDDYSISLAYRRSLGELSNDSSARVPVTVGVEETRESAPSHIAHKVVSGDTFSSIVSSYNFGSTLGISLQEALARLAKAEKSVNRVLPLGAELSFTLNEQGQVEAASLRDVPGRYIQFAMLDDGKYQAQLMQEPRVTQEHVLAGKIRTSLAEAVDRIGVSYDVVDDFVDLFSDRVVFHRDLHKGDEFVVVFRDEHLEDGTTLGNSQIIAASLTVKNRNLTAVRYLGSDGKVRYFNEKGELLGNTFLRYPVKFSRISSHFSYARFHPILKRNKPHNGVDFAAAVGTPVRSVANGVVTFAGWNGAAGKMVKIAHSKRYSTAYLHLSKIDKGIKKGARVDRGAQIGAVGTTGRSTGPHLHYSFYDNGKYVDPLKIALPTIDDLSKGNKIDKRYLQQAIRSLEHYKSWDSADSSDSGAGLADEGSWLAGVLEKLKASVRFGLKETR